MTTNPMTPTQREELIVEALDLENRLRGRYAKGPIMPSGEPEFGWQIFDRMPDGSEFPRIYGESADLIRRLTDALSLPVDREGGPGTSERATAPQEVRSSGVEPSAALGVHVYNPHPKYPWWCKDCGYAEHEILKHLQGRR